MLRKIRIPQSDVMCVMLSVMLSRSPTSSPRFMSMLLNLSRGQNLGLMETNLACCIQKYSTK